MLSPADQNTGDGLKKNNIVFPEGNKLFAGDFVLIWIKQMLIQFNLQRDGTRNGLPNIKEIFAESLKLQMPVLHQRMSIFQSSVLVSQLHMMAGQNAKEKYLMCQISIKMLKQEATPNSTQRFIYQKVAEKLVKNEYMQLPTQLTQQF